LKKALVIVAKEPEEEKVKTRLEICLAPKERMELYRCFLEDTVEEAILLTKRNSSNLFIAYTPARAEKTFRKMVGENVSLISQRGSNFGKRLENVFRDIFALDYNQVVLIGSDSPTLPLGFMNDAFQGLRDNDVIIGPATDGGYYLIGLTKVFPELFEGIDWSTSRVLGQTVTAISKLGLRSNFLPVWYDVDTPEQLNFLEAHLRCLALAKEGYLPKRTAAFFDIE